MSLKRQEIKISFKFFFVWYSKNSARQIINFLCAWQKKNWKSGSGVNVVDKFQLASKKSKFFPAKRNELKNHQQQQKKSNFGTLKCLATVWSVLKMSKRFLCSLSHSSATWSRVSRQLWVGSEGSQKLAHSELFLVLCHHGSEPRWCLSRMNKESSSRLTRVAKTKSEKI